jgi:hypothetical protein
MATHGAATADMTSDALRSINAMLGYVQQRVKRSDALTGAITSKAIDPFETAGLKLIQKRGNILLGIGDDGVRKVLGKFMSAEEAAADCISIIQDSNKIAITEIKGGKNILSDAVKKQLTNVVVAIDKAGWRSDIAYVELIVQKGVTFDEAQWIVKEGYLFNVLTKNRVAIPGFPNLFVRITEQEL